MRQFPAILGNGVALIGPSSVGANGQPLISDGNGNVLFSSPVVHAMGGEGGDAGYVTPDLSMTGLYDRNAITLGKARGSGSWSTVGTGNSTSSSDVAKLVNGNSDTWSITIGADTTKVTITYDLGSSVSHFGSASWQPFVHHRLIVGESFNSDGDIASYFNSITVEVSDAAGVTWIKPSGGEWETSDLANYNFRHPGLWIGENAVPDGIAAFSNVWQQVRFVFESLVQDPGYSSKNTFWLSQVGLRHRSEEYARQYARRDGATFYGPIVLPSYTDGSEPSTSDGAIIRNSTTGQPEVLVDSAWRPLVVGPPTGIPATGLVATTNGTDSDHDVDFSSGVAWASNADVAIYSSAAMTKKFDTAWAAGDGNGGLATGTLAADTWYDVYIIRNPTTGAVDFMCDTAANGVSNLPSGYTQYRRLGWASLKTDGSANFEPIEAGPDYWRIRGGTVANNATAASWTALRVNTPPRKVEVILRLKTDTAYNQIHVRAPGSSATFGYSLASASDIATAWVVTDDDGEIEFYVVGGNTADIYGVAWRDVA